MEKKYHTLIKDTFIFSIGKFGSRLILFFLVPLYTNYLTTGEYGTADLVFTISQLLTPVFSIVIFDSVIRFGLMKSEKRENVLYNSAIVWIVCVVLTCACIPLFSLYDSISSWRFHLAALIILVVAMNIEMNYLKVTGKNFTYSIISIIQSIVLATLNVIFLVKLSMGVNGYLLSTIISYGCCVVIAFVAGHVLRDLKKAIFKKQLMVEMLSFSAPLILNNISWWIIQSSDKLMLEAMISVSALGLYTAASKIPSLINVVVSIFQQSWGISSIREIESTNDNHFYENVLQIYSVAVFSCCLLLNCIIKPFMSIYVGNEFSESWKYVPLLVASAGFSAISAYFGSMYAALKKSVNNMVTTVIAATLNVVINFTFILLVGIWGAMIGTISSYCIIAFIRMYDVSRIIKLEVNWSRIIFNSLIILGHAILISIGKALIAGSVIAFCTYMIVNYSIIMKIVHKMNSFLVNKRK